ncbi:MAG TPA: TIGR03085 family metal-binding protein [Propionibacteriaceae bacterium]|nr:TIGR03085 family metal-binding protein [Propionibacteriaceae bacterium]
MTFAHDERLAFCDDALQAGPDAPTLDEGWTVADLVAHAYTRENDPLAALGIRVPQLAPLTARHMDDALRRHGFEGLVMAVRNGPGRFSPLRLPGVDSLVNGTEMFIHHEDIRRGSGEIAPRELPPRVEDELWRALGIAVVTLHNAPVGVVLERADSGASRRVKAGTRTVTLVGTPSELLLWVSGRQKAADVRLVGEADAVAALHAFTTSM